MSEHIPEGWKLIPIRDLISESRIQLDKDEPSKRLTVRLHFKGVEQRAERVSDQVSSTQYFKRRSGQFIYGKQNLHKGAVGLIPIKFDSFSSSQDIPAFNFSSTANPEWFLQYFKQVDFLRSLERIAIGTGSKRIKTEWLYTERIPVPPLYEQKKIASILISADEVIERKQKQIDKLKDLKKAIMDELLTKGIGHTKFRNSKSWKIPNSWKVIQIGSLGRFYGGLTGKASKDFGSGEPFLTYMQVFEERTSEKDLVDYVTISKAERQNKVQFGDILFTTSSETPADVGMTSVFLEEDWHPYLNSFCFGLRPKSTDLLYPYFAKFLFRGENFRKDIYPLAQGSTRFNLSKEGVKRIRIPVPPLSEQKNIASILTSIDKAIEGTQKEINKSQALKQSLMQDLLTGKIRVNV